MSGWIKLHRKIKESNMYKSLNSKQRDVMFACLLSVNHSESEWEFNGELFKCKAGQCVTSLDSLSKLCGKDVKVQSVRTALLKLEKWGFLTNESTKTGRLITICKWVDYQDKESEGNNGTNKDLTKNQQSSNKDLTPNKNVKKNKEGKELNKIDRGLNKSPQHKKSIEERKKEFQALIKKTIEGTEYESNKSELNNFYGYWTEHGDNDKKMKFEKQTSFSVKRRLSTWFKNDFNGTVNDPYKNW